MSDSRKRSRSPSLPSPSAKASRNEHIEGDVTLVIEQQNQNVARHYDGRPDQGLVKRMDSPIFHLRNYNNWIKSILIGGYLDRAKVNPSRSRDERNLVALDLKSDFFLFSKKIPTFAV